MLMVSCKKCGNEFIWLQGYNEYCPCGTVWEPFCNNEAKDDESIDLDFENRELRGALLKICKMTKHPNRDLASQMRSVAYRSLNY